MNKKTKEHKNKKIEIQKNRTTQGVFQFFSFSVFQSRQGIALIETLFSIAILALVALSLNSLFDLTLRVIWENKARAGAQSIANEKIEIAHNLPYTQVGTQGGIPSGSILQTEIVTINNIDYTVNSTVIFIDDPFDGTQGGNPDDLLPSDYKRLRIEISWNFRLQNQPVVFLSDIAPKGLESELGGGTLRITALDSSGMPVPQANVHIDNFTVTPNVDLDVLTNDSGQVLLPGATSSIETYNVIVSKAGYSADQTYAVDPVSLPTPIRPPLSVIEGAVTDATFSIDELSTMNISTVLAGDTCGVTKALDSMFAEEDSSPVLFSQRQPLQDQKRNTRLFHIALQDQIYVDGLTGSDVTGDGSLGNPYASLTRALQDVDQGEGDAINLAGGQTYQENPFVLDVTYSGTTSTPTIIQSWTGTATATIQTLGSKVFQFNGTKHFILNKLALTGATATEAVLIDDGTIDITVQNSLITGNNNSGIRIKGGSLHTIEYNTISSNGSDGIQIESTVNTVQGNIIHSNTGVGVSVTADSNDLIQNTLYGNSHGIEVTSADNLINNNVVYQNSQQGIYIHHSSGQNTVSNNKSYSNTGNGLLFASNGTSIISDNEAYLNALNGIALSSGSNTSSSNIVHDNILDGFYIAGDSNTLSNNQVYDNDVNGINAISTSGTIIQGGSIYLNSAVGVLLDTCVNCEISNALIYTNLSHGSRLDNSSSTTLSGNTINNNSGTGVELSNSSGIIVDHNLIYKQGSIGIELTGSTGSSVTSNTIAQNGNDGIRLLNSSTDNTITNNILSDNSLYGLNDQDDTSEPIDTYNLFYNNSSGQMRNLTPVAGGTGTLVDLDPLYVNLASDNYHLQSLKGYYPFGVGDISTSHSPAIDSGDTVNAYAQEQVPNGCNVNLGVYGNTLQASKSTEAGDPVPNLDFTLRGAKIIGQDTNGEDVYKYEQILNSGASGQVSTSTLEWDSYTFTVNSTSTGYDIAYIDPYQPINLLPNTTQNVAIGLIPDTQNTLHVLVIDAADGQVEEGADVRLYNVGLGFDETKQTPTHGQVFFDSLQVATYTLEVTKAGFQFYSINVDVSYYKSEIVNLSP